MLRGWLQNKKNASTQSLNVLVEPQNLEAAMRAATFIMNDDLDSAEAGLGEGVSSFHKLGKGMTSFLRAALGFEPDIMREATERLIESETQASSDHHKAQRDPHAYQSSIYPPGSEFALCHAMSQLMSAVVAVLNESLTDAIKGFYKLRRAYITLDGILEAERSYTKNRSTESMSSISKQSVTSLRSRRSAGSLKGALGNLSCEGIERDFSRTPKEPLGMHQNNGSIEPIGIPSSAVKDNEDEDEFFDAVEEHGEGEITSIHTGHGDDADGVTGKAVKPFFEEEAVNDSRTLPAPLVRRTTQHMIEHGPESDVFTNPIDVFIHSGSSLCFGFLLLMISMIPPAFGKLLMIIGFHGDRDRGIRMLWQATKFHNIMGAMSGLMLLGYYNGIVGFCDVLPEDKPGLESDNLDGYPKEKCEALLTDMRTRYPRSHLWLLEEARTQAANRHLKTAVELLSSERKSPMRQVAALAMFEKALNAMYLHSYILCADSFIQCTKLNNWSHALYYYIAGSAHVQLYRQFMTSDPKAAEDHARKAVEFLRHGPKHAGKKKFMAKQLPFDVFVSRKISKWEARAKDWNVPFIDAVGVSPIEEMTYFWNGYKRMPPAQLEQSLETLAWSEDLQRNPLWVREAPDEKAVLYVLRAVILRNLGRYEEAKLILNRDVIAVDKALLKGHLKDDWTAPVAHYEMGVNFWMQRHVTEGAVRESAEWVEKAARWEGYGMDARIGLKVTMAQDTLKKCGNGR